MIVDRYSPTGWKSGDKIESSNLNNIEQGINNLSQAIIENRADITYIANAMTDALGQIDDITSAFSFDTKKLVTFNTGGLAPTGINNESAFFTCSDFIDVSLYKKIRITILKYSKDLRNGEEKIATTAGIAFYSENKQTHLPEIPEEYWVNHEKYNYRKSYFYSGSPDDINNIPGAPDNYRFPYNQPLDNPFDIQVIYFKVPEGAKYVRTTWINPNIDLNIYNSFFCKGYTGDSAISDEIDEYMGVSFSKAQELTDEEKEIARININAASNNDIKALISSNNGMSGGMTYLKTLIPHQYTDISSYVVDYQGSTVLDYDEIISSFPSCNDIYDVPIFNSYVDEKIARVPSGHSFIFFTDTHWETNACGIQFLLPYIRNRLNIKPVIFGGDYINGETYNIQAKQLAENFTLPLLNELSGNYLYVMGNHDTNMGNYNQNLTEKQKEQKYLSPSKVERYLTDHSLKKVTPNYSSRINNFINTMKEKYNELYNEYNEAIDNITNESTKAKCQKSLNFFHELTEDQEKILYDELSAYFHLTYYVDYPEMKTRFLVVNTGSPNYGYIYDAFGIYNYGEMYLCADFIYETILSTPKDYNLVITGHWFTNYYKDIPDWEEKTYTVGSKVLYEYEEDEDTEGHPPIGTMPYKCIEAISNADLNTYPTFEQQWNANKWELIEWQEPEAGSTIKYSIFKDIVAYSDQAYMCVFTHTAQPGQTFEYYKNAGYWRLLEDDIIVPSEGEQSEEEDEEDRRPRPKCLSITSTLLTMLRGFKLKQTISTRVRPTFTKSILSQLNKVKFYTWTNLNKNFWRSPTSSSTQCDFTKASNINKAILIGGHKHTDDIFILKQNNLGKYIAERYDFSETINQELGTVPVISTNTDCYARPSPNPFMRKQMTLNTTTDQCLDVVTFTEEGVALTRFGVGDDRFIKIINESEEEEEQSEDQE